MHAPGRPSLASATSADLPESARAARELTRRCLCRLVEDVQFQSAPTGCQGTGRVLGTKEREAVEILSTNCSCRRASSREERIASNSKILRPTRFDSINRCDLIGRHEF